MSATIRIYAPIIDGEGNRSGEQMSVTAFMGGLNGNCIQLTTKNDYICLSEIQVEDLIEVLKKRLECKEGYTATGGDNEDVLLANGEWRE